MRLSAKFLLRRAGQELQQGPVKRVATLSKFKVDAPDGCVKGEDVTKTINGHTIRYFSFRGIPYAAPPVGELRFKSPRPEPLPVSLWDGCLRQQPNTKCVQLTVPGMQPVGQEDCLHLNVYVPGAGEVPCDRRMPVLVYIHGGGFLYGSGAEDENGPEFFMRLNNTVVVTLNYRLGAFGFLNLDNDDIPGNMGLKDQRAALQWVQRNIACFGGDPDRVTIFGNSAGAVSVHLHTLVKASKGLFRSAIMQSGNALAGFAYQENHHEMALRLSKLLAGSRDLPAERMAEAFRAATAEQIRNATYQIIKEDPQLQLGYPPFCPSPERRPDGAEDKFLERDPESLVVDRQVPAVPAIAGLSGEEGHFAYAFGQLAAKKETVAFLSQNPGALLPPNVRPYNDTADRLGVPRGASLSPEQSAVIAERIRREYNLDKTGDENHFISLLGDLFTVIATHRLSNLTLEVDPAARPRLYHYHFLEDGAFNWGKKSFGITAKGATHTDELGYLWRIDSLDQHAGAANEQASWDTLCLLTTLWTDFARDDECLEVEHRWPPAEGSARRALYAALSSDTRLLRRGLGGRRMALWDDVYATLRNK